MQMRTAATAILIVFLCFSCSRSTPEGATAVSDEVSQASQAMVGKQITIHGKFSLRGKVGPYIVLDNRQVVYLENTKGSFTWAKPYSEMEGQLVAATGTLRFYQEPPAEPTERAVTRVRDHFYFEAESVQLRLASR
jgi:hypothetical protein